MIMKQVFMANNNKGCHLVKFKGEQLGHDQLFEVLCTQSNPAQPKAKLLQEICKISNKTINGSLSSECQILFIPNSFQVSMIIILVALQIQGQFFI